MYTSRFLRLAALVSYHKSTAATTARLSIFEGTARRVFCTATGTSVRAFIAAEHSHSASTCISQSGAAMYETYVASRYESDCVMHL